jgi:hypothetical protein
MTLSILIIVPSIHSFRGYARGKAKMMQLISELTDDSVGGIVEVVFGTAGRIG